MAKRTNSVLEIPKTLSRKAAIIELKREGNYCPTKRDIECIRAEYLRDMQLKARRKTLRKIVVPVEYVQGKIDEVDEYRTLAWRLLDYIFDYRSALDINCLVFEQVWSPRQLAILREIYGDQRPGLLNRSRLRRWRKGGKPWEEVK